MSQPIGFDLIDYLTTKGLQVSRAAGPEVTVHCVFCPDGDHKGKGKLYLNTDSWLWSCKRCGECGNRRTLLRHFGDTDDLAYTPGADPNVRRQLLGEAAALAHEMLLSNAEHIDYLLDRGLSAETIVEAQFGYVPPNVGLTRMLPSADRVRAADLLGAGLLTEGGREWFNDSLTIPYFTHGAVVQLREKKRLGKYRTPPGEPVRLYNADALLSADDVVVTEGEYDCKTLEFALQTCPDAALRQIAVVGLPGAEAWPDGLEGCFSDCRRVFLGLDPDKTGRNAAAKLKAVIGSKARIVELPGGLPKTDWSDYLRPVTDANPNGGHTWRDVKNLLVEADLAGKRIFTVGEARARWGRIQGEQPGIKLGFAALDAVIRPGIKPGQIFIPVAKTGAGKSAWLSNVVHNARSRRVLYVSLELTAAEVFEHFRRIHHFWHPEDQSEDLDRDYATVRIIDQNRLRPGDLSAMVAEYREALGAPPELLVVDYLQYFARGARGSTPYERVSEATLELKEIAKEEGLAILVPSQVNRGAKDGSPFDADDIRDSGVVEETGDFLLSLFRPDHVIKPEQAEGLPPQTGVLNMQLLKSRHGGKGRLFNARFSNMSLVIVDVLDRKSVIRVDQENGLYRQGVHYDDFRHDATPALFSVSAS